MRPTGRFLSERFFVIYGAVQLLGIVALAVPSLFLGYMVSVAALAVILLVDRKTCSSSVNAVSVAIPRDIMLFQSFDAGVEIVPSAGILYFDSVRFEFAPARCLEFENSKPLSLAKIGGRYVFAGAVKVKGILLGRETVSNGYVLSRSRLGLWTAAAKAEFGPARVQVNPRQRNLSEQEFTEIARRNQLFLGSRLRLRGQSPDLYYTSRKFQYPDSLRYIDHKRTARFGELMTKTFEEMRNHRLIIGLDVGRAMSGKIAGSNKHDFYLSAAMAMAKHAVQSRDSVDFFAFSQRVHTTIQQARSLDPFRILVEKSEMFYPRAEETNFDLVNAVVSRLTGQRSIVVLLTDSSKPGTQKALVTAMEPVCRRHLAVVVGLIDNEYQLDAQVLGFRKDRVDDQAASRLLYGYWLQEQFKLFQSQLNQFGGASLALSEEYWMSVIERLYSGLRQSLFA